MWALTSKERKILKKVIPTEFMNQSVKCPNGEEISIEELCKKNRISAAEVAAMHKILPSDVEFYKFVNALRPRQNTDKSDEEELTEAQKQAKRAYRKRIQQLKDRQAQLEYAQMTETIDPMRQRKPIFQDFGQEMREVNRQMVAVFNTLITVGGAFAFGFWGIRFAYPHLGLDIAERMLLGLVFGTIVFFADLYFIIKGMEKEEKEKNL